MENFLKEDSAEETKNDIEDVLEAEYIIDKNSSEFSDIPSSEQPPPLDDFSLPSKQNTNPEKNFSDKTVSIKDTLEYTFKKEFYNRHKIIEETLLTSDLIQTFDRICEDIVRREKNYFNLSEYLLSSNTDHVWKKVFRKNFLKIVDLLSSKNIPLVKVLEKDTDGSPLTITLLEKKNFDLFLFHKFNDFIIKSYDLENRHRKPILYNLIHISAQLRIPPSELSKMCIRLNSQTISLEELNSIQNSSDSGTAALIIDLNHKDFGEAIVPIYFAHNLLDYLTSQIKAYMEDINNEKIVALVNKKLRENNLEISTVKKNLIKPNPQNSNFEVFIRIFYSIFTQIYNNFNNNNSKEIESYIIISFLVRQLIFNSKTQEESQDIDNNKDNLELSIIRILLNNIKELNHKTIRVPLDLKNFIDKWNKANSKNISTNLKPREFINTIKNLNADGHTIKEVLIFRLIKHNYYLHRTSILPLFLAMLKVEIDKISEYVEVELRNSKSPLQNQEVWDEFIKKKVSPFFISIHETLKSCFMAVKPTFFEGNQTQYWLERLFFDPQEIKNYNLFKSDLDIDESSKRKMLKDAVSILIDTDQNFESLPVLLNVPYSKYISVKDINSIRLIIETLKTMVYWVLSYKPKKKKNRKQTSQKNMESFYLNPLLKEKKNNLALLKFIEQKFPLLEDTDQLQKIIDDEHDNWNIKIGDKRKDNKQIIDNLIRNCIIRFDIKQILNENFESTYNLLLRNNPLLKQIKNQKSLKKYMFYRILLEKHRKIKRESGIK